MLSHRIARLAAVTAAGTLLAVATPLIAQSPAGQTPNAAQTQHPRHHGHRMLAGLNLTSDQQAKIKAIHEKYRDQLSASRAAAKPDLDAARAARARGDTAGARAAFAKAREAMKASDPVRKQEMDEVRNVLTAEQRQTLDTQKAQWKASHGTRKHAKS